MSYLVLGVVIWRVLVSSCAQEIDLRLENITESLVTYQYCRVDSDCRENSFCFDNDNVRNGLCKCLAGYELLTRNRTYYTCLKLANWGEPCELSGQCIDDLGPLGVCKNGKCGCNDGYDRYAWDGRCHSIVSLGDFCRTDANCLLGDGSHAFCTDGRCICNIGYTPTVDRKKCVEARYLGEECSNHDQCSVVEHASCQGVCTCSLGYVISRNGTKCLRAALRFNDSCIENDQCSEFLRDSVCTGQNCTCPPNFHGFENRCARSVTLGNICSATEHCILRESYMDKVDCLEGVCQCKQGVTDEQIGCTSCRFSVNLLVLGFSFLVYKLLFL